MKKLLFAICLIINHLAFSQIVGKVTDKEQNPLPFVNIYLENTSVGTTSNQNGDYTLFTSEKNPTIIFQFLGYKTEKRTLHISKLPHRLDIALSEEIFSLSGVEISNKENPANEIIRNAIKSKGKNSELATRFEADFYSKGIIKMKDIPKKIMGEEVGDLNGNIDTITRQGIMYQSETISKVKFEKPNRVKEHIIASKVAGNDNGFSFNSAEQANFDLYDNYIDFGIKFISPIADNAFSYYKFVLESSFYDDKNHLINKIKITPKRDKEPVFEGFIYVVEDSWALYGADLTLKGYRMQNPMIKELHLVQNFVYDNAQKSWNKKLQTFGGDLQVLMIKLGVNFSYMYNNYIFKKEFDKKEFKNEIRSFAQNANKKDSLYWEKYRQIPLTDEEVRNYHKKDSLFAVRNSEKYLDSLDNRKTPKALYPRFFLMGYTKTYRKKNLTISYDGLANFGSGYFNSVQGFTMGTGVSLTKRNPEKNAETRFKADAEYAFAENRFRAKGKFTKVFNKINYPILEISGGEQVSQFNPNNPISPFVNAVATLFFKDNYMKVYHQDFAQIGYEQYLTKDVNLKGLLMFSNRNPLVNNTNYSFFKKEKPYTSNNPLDPENDTQLFENHYVTEFSLLAQFYINRRYVSYPNRREFVSDERYPSFKAIFTNAFSASKKAYQYQFMAGQMNYTPSFDNKGEMAIRLTAGTFFNAENIQFIDYQHFNGNQTHISLVNTNNEFGLLPYYSHSTNKAFVTTHLQHHFRGFLANKIPIFNKLQWNFVVGFHQLIRSQSTPYQEFSVGLENIGFGSFRFLRVDYIRSYQNGFKGDGVLFGLSLPISVE